MKKQKMIIAGAAILVGAIAITTAFLVRDSKPLYKDVTGYNDGNYLYSCSKPLKAKLQRIPGPLSPSEPKKYESYVPVDKSAAKLYCHSNAVIENEGKVKVLQRPEVEKLVSKYQPKDVRIRALEFKYIKDADFVDRLLPSLKDREIGCVIVLTTPGEDRVYLEDERLETFAEFDYKTFSGYLGRASSNDRKLFYKNLQ